MPLRACSLALVVGAAVGLGAQAGSAAAPKALASYCSPSGDVCFGVINRGGAAFLELSLAARYFARYRLCVRPPGTGTAGAARCRSFSVVRRGAIWGSSIKYGREYPVGGPGIYRVTWHLGTKPLGPTLRFRLPLRA